MRIPPRTQLLAFARSWLPEEKPSSARRYGWSLLMLAVAILAGGWLHPVVPDRLFITIYPAVAVVSILWGVGPAVVVALAGGVLAVFLWIPPENDWPPPDVAVANLAVFWGMTGIIVALGHLVHLLFDELRTSEREAVLRAGELHHRIQNLFNLVISAGRISAPNAASVDEFWKGLESRLMGLSEAQTLIVSPEDGVDLESLMRRILAGHGIDRFRFSGVPCIVRTSTSLVLGLHELATNSAKYGALSAEGGMVAVEWHAETGKIEVLWSERGGPVVQEPTRRGFGSTVLRSLGARTEFLPEGLNATFSIIGSASADQVAAGDGIPERRSETAVLRIERTASGHAVARIGSHWLPGIYADTEAARLASRLPDRVLRMLWGEDEGFPEVGERNPLTAAKLEVARRRWLAREI